jgi:cytochrome c
MRIFALLLLLMIAPPGHAQPVHTAPIRALAILPDWSVASAGLDGTIIRRRLSDGAATRERRAHDGAVNALVALADGRLVSGGADGRLAIWARNEPTPVAWLEGHAAAISALATDGTRIASGSWLGIGIIWDGDDGRVLSGHDGPIGGIGFLPDGTPVTAGFDGTVRLWPADGMRIIARLPAAQNALAVLPDALALAGADGVLRLLGHDGTPRGELQAGSGPLVALAASAERLAVASIGGAAVLVDPAKPRITTVINTGEPVLWAVAFSPDGDTLLTGGADRVIRTWDPATGRALAPLGPVPPRDAPLDSAERGAQLFRACAICHALARDAPPRAGPNLAGIIGRQAGSLPGYAYSDALRTRGIVWSEASIAQLFGEGPHAFVPGTTMPEQVISDPADRAALASFLARATK